MTKRRRKRSITHSDRAEPPKGGSPPGTGGTGPDHHGQTKPQEPAVQSYEEASLALGLGEVRRRWPGTGRLPLTDQDREFVARWLMAILRSEEVEVRDQIRAAQTIVAIERLNIDSEAREAAQGPAEPPTIYVAEDPEYIRWKHERARLKLQESDSAMHEAG